jgi:hypothetical protein
MNAFTARLAIAALSALLDLTGLLPGALHPGKRVNHALRDVKDASRGRWLERRVIESRWQSFVLQRYVLGMDESSMRVFFDERVLYEGSTWPLDERRPLILAAPHFGAAGVGFLAAVHRMHRRRPINLFVDAGIPTRQLTALFEMAGLDLSRLMSGFAGSVEAARALRRGECLIMMPDVFSQGCQTLVVPFFGRLMRVAAATAFLALRTGALVVPVFATPGTNLTLRVLVDTPIDARRYAGDDDQQKIFMLTQALFARFESVFRFAPEHWHGWERLPGTSTAIDPAYRLDYDEPLRVLRAKCDARPHLVQEIPELDLIRKEHVWIRPR